MTHHPIATPRGTLRATIASVQTRRIRTRVHIWDNNPQHRHPGIPNPGDALLHISADALDLEIVISGAEIEPMADAFLACVQMRAEHEEHLAAPATRQRDAA